jgi:hypothetical protein
MLRASTRPVLYGSLSAFVLACASCSGSGGNSPGSGSSGGAGSGSGVSTGSSGTGTGSSSGGGSGAAGTGSGASGGTTGSSGSSGAGGSGTKSGSTGSSGTTGSSGSSGTGSSGAGGGADSGLPPSTCTFTQTSTTSTKIPTVGIVTWSTTLSAVTSANVNFGLTTSYGMTAPVDLTQMNYRTLLLGMKASKTYHYQIVASTGTSQCTSPDYTIMTGALANGLPTITVSTMQASKVYGGFLITGQYVTNAGTSGSPAYILDADGDYVWWYNISTDVTGVRMSYDGTHMWINAANVPQGTAVVHRVTMDGMTDDNYSTQLANMNHQLTILPDETVAFYAYNSQIGCEDVKEMAPDGGVKTLVNAQTAEGSTGSCHLNNVEYSATDDTEVFSDLDHNCVVKITRDGKTVWVLNGATSQFTGDTWAGGQHGINVLGASDFLIFNNENAMGGGAVGGTGGGNGQSMAIEEMIDVTGKTVMRSWSYKPSPSISNAVMGDVQRLPNGNTIVAFSTAGALHEVDSTGNVVQELTWPLGASFGYIEKRATLYGPPPK